MRAKTLFLFASVALGFSALAAVSPTQATATAGAAEEGLVAHWSFDDPANPAADVSGNGNDGVVYGAQPVDGVLGSALDFDGIDDEVRIPDRDNAPPASIAELPKGSIALWVRYDDVGQEAATAFYLGSPLSDEKPGFMIEIGHPETKALYATWFASPNPGQPGLCFDSRVQLEAERWYHVVVVVDDNSNTGYLDGVELVNRDYNFGDAEDSLFFAHIAEPTHLALGSGQYKRETIEPLAGALDDVRIYDRPLSAADVWELYSGSGPSNTTPVAADDVAATGGGVPVVVDVLENDVDPDGDLLVVTGTSTPSHGSANTDGTAVTYTPEADFEGTDAFDYTVTDPHGSSDTATVTVTVTASPPNAPPPAPTGLTATAPGDGTIVLSWTDVGDGPNEATSFEVERRQGGVRGSTLIDVPADTTTFVDTSVATGGRYSYRVRAINAAGVSAWSNRVRIRL